MNGPVPLELSDAKPSSLFLKSIGLTALFFSHQALFMIWIVDRCSRNTGLKSFSVNSTVNASTFLGSPTALA